MSSSSRTPPIEPPDDRVDDAEPTSREADVARARRDVERAVIRLQSMGVQVSSLPDREDPAAPVAPVATAEPEGSAAVRQLRAAERRAELEHASELEAELEEARRRSGRVFGRRAARRVASLEQAEQLARARATPRATPVLRPSGPGVVDLEDLELALADLHEADERLADLLAADDPSARRRRRPWRPVALP